MSGRRQKIAMLREETDRRLKRVHALQTELAAVTMERNQLEAEVRDLRLCLDTALTGNVTEVGCVRNWFFERSFPALDMLQGDSA